MGSVIRDFGHVWRTRVVEYHAVLVEDIGGAVLLHVLDRLIILADGRSHVVLRNVVDINVVELLGRRFNNAVLAIRILESVVEGDHAVHIGGSGREWVRVSAVIDRL